MLRTKSKVENITPEVALQLLKDGNARFINNITINRDHLQHVNDTQHGQEPFAAILGCMDSRAPSEIIFDQGIGDIFNVRIAGNIISENVLGSLEYAVAVAHSKLIVVMGHTNCGAIKGACDGVEMGNITLLLDKIKPVLNKVEEFKTMKSGDKINTELINKVAAHNVYHSVEQMMEQSQIINEHVKAGKIKVVPAMYDISTGIVNFLDEKRS